MKPYMTIVLAVAVVALAAYYHISKKRSDPRIDRFVECYVELSLLHRQADTTASVYFVERDSILNLNGFTEQTLLAYKEELNRDPTLIAVIWDKIETKLKQRKEQYDLKE